MQKLKISNNVAVMQKTALLKTAAISRKVFEMQRTDRSVSLWPLVMNHITQKTTAMATTRT